MTTIAWDGRTLASDSQVTGDYLENTFVKIRRFRNVLCGACGAMEQAELFFRWVKDGMPDKRPELTEIDALLVRGKTCYWYGEKLIGIRAAKLSAIGSGARFAIAAMHCGKTSKEAIALARKLDAGTGGRIRSITL